jgi:hypothetical protein
MQFDWILKNTLPVENEVNHQRADSVPVNSQMLFCICNLQVLWSPCSCFSGSRFNFPLPLPATAVFNRRFQIPRFTARVRGI